MDRSIDIPHHFHNVWCLWIQRVCRIGDIEVDEHLSKEFVNRRIDTILNSIHPVFMLLYESGYVNDVSMREDICPMLIIWMFESTVQVFLLTCFAKCCRPAWANLKFTEPFPIGDAVTEDVL